MNDLVGFYRNMNLVYATKDDFIDTLAWEGIREGIDDIRYATLCSSLPTGPSLPTRRPRTRLRGPQGVTVSRAAR